MIVNGELVFSLAKLTDCSDDSEVSSLMTEEQYIQYLKEEDLITEDGDPKPSS